MDWGTLCYKRTADSFLNRKPWKITQKNRKNKIKKKNMHTHIWLQSQRAPGNDQEEKKKDLKGEQNVSSDRMTLWFRRLLGDLRRPTALLIVSLKK